MRLRYSWITFGVSILAVIVCFGNSAVAQTRDLDVISPDQHLPAAGSIEPKIRDLNVLPLDQHLDVTFTYHALIIGIDQYRSPIPSLTTAVKDAKAVSSVLVGRYGFKTENIVELYNAEATRSNILRVLRELTRKLVETDCLFIYYAGHGVFDDLTNTGNWVPADAELNLFDSYLPNTVLRDYLKASKSKHIYVVVDSCFSGALLTHRSLPQEIDIRYYREVAKRVSRQVLTSGGLEPVADEGASGHSIFAYFFLKALKENEKPFIAPSEIYTSVSRLVSENSAQTPVQGPLRDCMDEGGEMVLALEKVARPTIVSFTANEPSLIYLNDRYLGQTPILGFSLNPGPYRYRIVCPSLGQEKAGSFNLSPGDQKDIAENFSQAAYGFLTVSTTPWTYVYLNNEKIGETPIIQMQLKPGVYVLKLENKEFKILEVQELVIRSEQTTKVVRQLK